MDPVKPKVVLYHPVAEAVRQLLGSRFEVTAFDRVTPPNREAFLSAVQGAEGLIGMGMPVRMEDLRECKHLRVIATISTGYDGFDVAELTERKIVLLNLYDPLTETTADLAFALIMAAARRIAELDRKIRQGLWERPGQTSWFGTDVNGKILGIVGMGRIGASIARRGALGCNMPILYTARSSKPEVEKLFGAQRRDLDSLLRESDFVCLVVPLSDETCRLIGARELKLMKPTSILINIARGPVVDEAALIDALRNGTIHAAGLDVYETEPLPAESPLMGLDNVVLAPHVGSATTATRDAMALYSAESLVAFLCRGEARSAVNPEALG